MRRVEEGREVGGEMLKSEEEKGGRDCKSLLQWEIGNRGLETTPTF